MKIRYFPDTDTLHIEFRDVAVAVTWTRTPFLISMPRAMSAP